MDNMDYMNLLYSNDSKGLNEYLKSHDINKRLNGQSLLHWAVHNNNFEFTKQLVYRGANIDICDNLGRTPLVIASFFGFVQIASFLLENGANMSGCIERAKHGWDGNIQTEIFDLLKHWGRM